MRTAYSHRPCVILKLPDVSNGGGSWVSEVNKVEQVSIDGHQISLAEGPCPVRWHVGGEGAERTQPGGSLYFEVPCIIGNGHMEPAVDRDRH